MVKAVPYGHWFTRDWLAKVFFYIALCIFSLHSCFFSSIHEYLVTGNTEGISRYSHTLTIIAISRTSYTFSEFDPDAVVVFAIFQKLNAFSRLML